MNKWIALSGLLLMLLAGGKTLFSDATATEVQAPVFWHLGLVVGDLDSMDRFYSEVIGLQRVSELLVEDAAAGSGTEGAIIVEDLDTLMGITGTRIKIRQFSDPQHNQFFELIYYPDHPAETVNRSLTSPLGLAHLALNVPDLDAVVERMERHNLGSLVSGPRSLPEFDGTRYAFLKDPEGNLVELMEAVTGSGS
jgi:catechol 2,3-dioxygenase-like lactoylglutathione lyase family enzyme